MTVPDHIIEILQGQVDELTAQRDTAVRERDRYLVALEHLVKLQAHYAELLNMHDGGERHPFASVEDYLQRLVEIGRLP